MGRGHGTDRRPHARAGTACVSRADRSAHPPGDDRAVLRRTVSRFRVAVGPGRSGRSPDMTRRPVARSPGSRFRVRSRIAFGEAVSGRSRGRPNPAHPDSGTATLTQIDPRSNRIVGRRQRPTGALSGRHRPLRSRSLDRRLRAWTAPLQAGLTHHQGPQGRGAAVWSSGCHSASTSNLLHHPAVAVGIVEGRKRSVAAPIRVKAGGLALTAEVERARRSRRFWRQARLARLRCPPREGELPGRPPPAGGCAST